MKNIFSQKSQKSERGQAIILIIFAFIGLVAMVGLVTDTGLTLIQYGKLKRAVDAAAIAAAQEYRPDPDITPVQLNRTAMREAAINFLQLNDIQASTLIMRTCEDTSDRPALCNPNPTTRPENNRKLVEIVASVSSQLGFLRVIGIRDITLTATAVGEASTMDLVLILDTSGFMANETSATGTPDPYSPLNDPNRCNTAASNDHPCQPMKTVKTTAANFVKKLIYPNYDRVAIITTTSQSVNGDRNPVEVRPLSFDGSQINTAITNINVFNPRVCANPYSNDTLEGQCRAYNNLGKFTSVVCPAYENFDKNPNQNPSSCTSNNIGGALKLAQYALQGSGDSSKMRLQALWIVVGLFGGRANATDPVNSGSVNLPNGYCPETTFFDYKPYYGGVYWCNDSKPSTRHSLSDPLVNWKNPVSGITKKIRLYDPDDYARDSADVLAASSSKGVIIYTIGLGKQIAEPAKKWDTSVDIDDPVDNLSEEPPAAALLEYIALEAGDALNSNITHGIFTLAKNSEILSYSFDLIARNISTKISQ
ncbi:MAG: pilus assembly protein TadG-related protein [Anaerolineales bacterium]|nr:pilus assembly protein TadG-related protein [Anaerolineales bacterium]